MSSATPTPTPQPRPEPDSAVSLEDYRYAADRVAGAGARSWQEWVLLDEDELVLDVYSSRVGAVGELNARFDANPGLVERLRLVVLCLAQEPVSEWPRGGSLAERAGALARHISNANAPTDDEVIKCVRAHFLRGEFGWTDISGWRRRSVELWWYANHGKHEPVGVLIEHVEEGAWQLLLDGRSRGLTAHQLHRRVAQVMRRLGDERWTETQVAAVGGDDFFGRCGYEHFGPAALYVRAMLMLANELHVSEPLGRSWP